MIIDERMIDEIMEVITHSDKLTYDDLRECVNQWEREQDNDGSNTDDSSNRMPVFDRGLDQ